MNINKAVKVLMVEQGLRAVDVANELKVSRQALNSAVGKKGNPSVYNETLHGVCRVLGVKLSELIARAEGYDR